MLNVRRSMPIMARSDHTARMLQTLGYLMISRRNLHKLVVRELSEKTTYLSLLEYYTRFGDVRGFRLLDDSSPRVAFIYYDKIQAINKRNRKALNSGKHVVDGRTLIHDMMECQDDELDEADYRLATSDSSKTVRKARILPNTKILIRKEKRCTVNKDPAQFPRFSSAKDLEKRMTTLTSTDANLTNRIQVYGPCLHPMEENPRDHQREELWTYFGQFGKIINVSVRPMFNGMRTDSRVTFASCDSTAKCLEQCNHKILGQNFGVQRNKPSKGARRKIKNLPHLPEENAVSNPNYQGSLPEGLTNSIIDLEERIVSITSSAVYLTNRIHVSGPCLYPMEDNASEHQREDLRTYFGQYGKIINISVKRILDDMTTDSRVTFAHCDSVAKCLEQDNHKILGQDFGVQRGQPSKGAKKKIKTEEKKKRKCKRP